jgi:hypothetical protein
MEDAAGCQAWIDRCHLPLLVDVAVAVRPPIADDAATRIVLDGGDRVAVASDLSAAVPRKVRPGELLCLRLSDGIAVAVDFADGRLPLVSATLRHAAGRRPISPPYAAAGTIS